MMVFGNTSITLYLRGRLCSLSLLADIHSGYSTFQLTYSLIERYNSYNSFKLKYEIFCFVIISIPFFFYLCVLHSGVNYILTPNP